MKLNRYEERDMNSFEPSGSRNDAGKDRSMEQENRTEIEQPTPSTATPGIPDEMPAREIR